MYGALERPLKTSSRELGNGDGNTFGHYKVQAGQSVHLPSSPKVVVTVDTVGTADTADTVPTAMWNRG